MRAGGWMPAPATAALILRRKVEFAPLSVFLRTANCQGVSEREQEDDVAKVKAETRAATVLRFKCFLLSFHPSLSLAQITLSLLCQRALRSLQAPSPLSPLSPLPFVRLPLFSSMQISFRKWKFFRDIVKTSSARRPSTARRASGGEVARSR